MLMLNSVNCFFCRTLGISTAGCGPNNGIADACLASLSASSLPVIPQCPGTQTRVTSFRLASTESIQAFCNQSWSYFWATKRLNCSLAVIKNKNPVMFISPSYISTCTLQNGMYFSLKNRDKLSGREAESAVWSDAKNIRPCPWVSPRAVSEPD